MYYSVQKNKDENPNHFNLVSTKDETRFSALCQTTSTSANLREATRSCCLPELHPSRVC